MKVALIQYAPIFLDRQASTKLALEKIAEASEEGAELVVFGECWLGGYPAWADHYPKAALWDHEPVKKVYRKMHEEAVSVSAGHLDTFQEIARKKKIAIILGANERISPKPGSGTLYNSIFGIDENGKLALHHRKLMPTYTERLLYGTGDGAGLHTFEVQGIQTGALICWEHWMPLTRQAIHQQHELIHVALWPSVHEMHQIASRHYAFEGRCFVLAVGQMMRFEDVPEEIQSDSDLHEDPQNWLLNGGSAVIGPNGKYITEPVFDKECILYSEFDPAQALEEKMTLDVIGHYARPDVFDFRINRKRITE